MTDLTLMAAGAEVRQAAWTQQIRRSALQELLTEASRPEILSLALGLPAAELFPSEDFAHASLHVLATDSRALQYGPPSQSLKRWIVSLMKQRGVTCRESQVFLTTGAQQGLSLLTRLLLDPGGTILTEELVYPGFQQAVQPFQPIKLTVPTDLETGMDVDAVDDLLSNGVRPALIYTVTDGHNPLGVSMSPAKRRRLTDLASYYGVPIIEDDPYGFLSYAGTPSPALRSYNDQSVFYVGSFSKIFAPAVRVGWLIVPEELIPNLAILKESSDIDSATFSQRALAAYMDTGLLDQHLPKLCRTYRARRDAMLLALDRYFPREARWHCPNSGVFIWVELPGQVDSTELCKFAMSRERVAFVPGRAFCMVDSSRANASMRLNFSHSSPEKIEEGIARLASALNAMERVD
jgi:2-aminoadipate transaminase